MDDPGFKIVTARVREHLAGQHDQDDHGKWAAGKAGNSSEDGASGGGAGVSASTRFSVTPPSKAAVTVAAPKKTQNLTRMIDSDPQITLKQDDRVSFWGRGTLQEVAERMTRGMEKFKTESEGKPAGWASIKFPQLETVDYFASPADEGASATTTTVWDDNLGIERQVSSTDSTQYTAAWTDLTDGEARQVIRAITREAFIEDVAAADGISKAKAAESVDKVMGSIRSKLTDPATKIIIGVPAQVFDEVMADGEVKTQFETGTSQGVLDTDFRGAFENIVFGSEGEVRYAYLDVLGERRHSGYEENRSGQYGQFELTLKNEVKERSTFTVEDSLDTWGNQDIPYLPTPILNPQWEAFSASDVNAAGMSALSSTTDLTEAGNNNYIEAQVHGPVTFDDVEKVTFYPDMLEGGGMAAIFGSAKGAMGFTSDVSATNWLNRTNDAMEGLGFELKMYGPTSGITRKTDGTLEMVVGNDAAPFAPIEWIRKQKESYDYNTSLYNNLLEHLPGQHDQDEHGKWAQGLGGGKNEGSMAAGGPSAGPIKAAAKVKAIVGRKGNFQRDRMSDIKSWREGKPRERGVYDSRTNRAAKDGRLRWVIEDPQLFATRGYENLTAETVFDTPGDDSRPRGDINSTGTNEVGYKYTTDAEGAFVSSRNSPQKSLLMAEARLAALEGRIDDAKEMIASSMQGDGINLVIPHMTVDLSKTTVEEATKGLKVLDVISSPMDVQNAIGYEGTWDFDADEYGLGNRWGDKEPSKYWSEEDTQRWEAEKNTVIVLLDNRQEMLDGLPAWAKISDADATERLVTIQKDLFIATFKKNGLGSAAEAEAAMEKIIARKQEIMNAGNLQAVMHVPETALKKILASSNGAIGNQHEVGGGYGLRDVEIRKAVEQAMFGTEWSPEEAPKYMYANRADLSDEAALIERSQYGKFAIVFDGDALGNATAYPGDTLDAWSRSGEISEYSVNYAINDYNDRPENRLADDLQTHIALYLTQNPGTPMPIENWANYISPQDVAYLDRGYRVPEPKGTKYDPDRKDVYIKGVDGVLAAIDAEWMAGEGNGRSYDEVQMHGALNISDASEVRLLPSDITVDWTNKAEPGEPGIKYSKPYTVPGAPAIEERYQPAEGIDKIGIQDPAKVQAAIDLLTKNLAKYGFALAEGGAIQDGKVVLETVKYKTGDQVFEIPGQITKPIRWIKQYTGVKESLLFGVSWFISAAMEVEN